MEISPVWQGDEKGNDGSFLRGSRRGAQAGIRAGARSDRRQAVTRAEEYRERAEADARGRSREIADRSAARVDRVTRVAQGEADRFSKVLAESSKAPDATRRRLYLELIAELLPKLGRKVVVGLGTMGGLGIRSSRYR